MKLILALLPIISFFIMVVIVKKNILYGAVTSFVLSTILGVLFYNSSFINLINSCMEGAWNSFVILIVVFNALLLFNILKESGSFEMICKWISDNILDEYNRIIFVGWGFSSLLQGISGFGVPVAVVAPILTKMGLNPIQAIIICLLGHSWGGTFGTLGIAWDTMLAQIPNSDLISYNSLLIGTCCYLSVFNIISGIVICFVINKKFNKKSVLTSLAVSLTQCIVLLLASLISTKIAFLSMMLILLLDRGLNDLKKIDSHYFIKSFIPFIVMIIVLAFYLLPVSLSNLNDICIGFPFKVDDGIRIYGETHIFTHSGTVLLIVALINWLIYRKKIHSNKAVFAKTVNGSIRAILPIVFLLMTARIMVGSGQTDIIALKIGEFTSNSYGFFAPYIGILGGFVCSSNMSSNILFTYLQYNIAISQGINVNLILAAQTAGGAIGILMSSNSIILGSTTLEISNVESEIMKKMMCVCVFTGGVLGVLCLVFTLGG